MIKAHGFPDTSSRCSLRETVSDMLATHLSAHLVPTGIPVIAPKREPALDDCLLRTPCRVIIADTYMSGFLAGLFRVVNDIVVVRGE